MCVLRSIYPLQVGRNLVTTKCLGNGDPFFCELSAEPVLFCFVLFFSSRQFVAACMSQLSPCQGVNRVNLWLLFALLFTSYVPLRRSIMALNRCIILYHYMGLLYIPSLPASLCLSNCDNAADVLRQWELIPWERSWSQDNRIPVIILFFSVQFLWRRAVACVKFV